jgi:hypothetical protein
MTSTVFPASPAVAAGTRVGAALRSASARTGIAFDYLVGEASLESGLDPGARSASSSATGLFQFIDQTWLATVRKHGASHGLGWAADAIQIARGGRLSVADPALRQQILDLRKIPEAASAMAAEFAADNKEALEQTLGRAAQPVDLYLAHFLGLGGAKQFLRAHEADPDAPAAALLPKAAQANRPVFFNRDGSPRSLAEIRSRFAMRIGGSSPLAPAAKGLRLAAAEFVPLSAPGGVSTAVATARRRPAADSGMKLAAGEFIPLKALDRSALARAAPSPKYARLAYLMLAQLDA